MLEFVDSGYINIVCEFVTPDVPQYTLHIKINENFHEFSSRFPSPRPAGVCEIFYIDHVASIHMSKKSLNRRLVTN